MNDLIGERMEQVYQEKDGQQYDPFNEKLEMKLQKRYFRNFQINREQFYFDYMTETSNKMQDLNEFYYRMGLRDGLMLKSSNSGYAGRINGVIYNRAYDMKKPCTF